MNDINFNNLTELFNRLYPALDTKVNEFKALKIDVTPYQLWNYLKDNYWSSANNLELYQMASDILSLDIARYIEMRDKNEN